MYRRLRDEVPLYYNATYDFYALSRFTDVSKALADHDTFSSARGGGWFPFGKRRGSAWPYT